MIWNSNVEIFCEVDCDNPDCGKCNKYMARVTCTRCDKIIVYPIAQDRRPKYCTTCIDTLGKMYSKTGSKYNPTVVFYVKLTPQSEPEPEPKKEPEASKETDGKATRIDSVGIPTHSWYNPTYED